MLVLIVPMWTAYGFCSPDTLIVSPLVEPKPEVKTAALPAVSVMVAALPFVEKTTLFPFLSSRKLGNTYRDSPSAPLGLTT